MKKLFKVMLVLVLILIVKQTIVFFKTESEINDYKSEFGIDGV